MSKKLCELLKIIFYIKLLFLEEKMVFWAYESVNIGL
jgi:hypothetical protein